MDTAHEVRLAVQHPEDRGADQLPNTECLRTSSGADPRRRHLPTGRECEGGAPDRPLTRTISAWLAFWDRSNWHVNARHKDVYYRQIAQDIACYLPSPTAHVLDYGSGEALHANVVAAAAG